MGLEGKSLKSDFMKFIIPSVVAQWVYSLYTMVDGMFVAKGVSEVALTAVNLSFPVLAFLFAVALMFAVGTSTVIGILLGKKKVERASEIFTQNIAVQLIIAVVFVFLGMTHLDEITRFLGAKDGILFQYVKEYLTWIIPFAAAFLLSYSLEILLKIDGYPRKATMIVVTGTVANCILDWLFVIVLQKGVAGAALATGLSQLAVFFLYLHHFLGKKGVLFIKKFKWEIHTIFREMRNGFSAGFTELSSGIVTFIFNQVILTYLNQDALVGYTIVAYVNSIVVLSATGIAQGSQPLISYYYGMGKLSNCKKLLKYSLTAAGGLCIGAFLLLFPAAQGIVSIYVSPELLELRQYSVEIFHIYTTSFFLVGFNVAVSGYFTSVERAVSALIISAGRGFVLLVGVLLFFANCFGGDMIWWSPLVSEGICFGLTLLLFVRYWKDSGMGAVK